MWEAEQQSRGENLHYINLPHSHRIPETLHLRVMVERVIPLRDKVYAYCSLFSSTHTMYMYVCDSVILCSSSS